MHELDFHTEHGSVRVTDFMPPRGTAPDVVRIVEGLEGSVPMRMELVIRFDYGSIVPWVRRLEDDTRIAIAGPDAVAFRTPVEVRGENMSTVAEFTAQPGERDPVRADVVPVAPRAAARDHARARVRRHVLVLGRVARHECSYSRPLRGGGLPLADGAEGADVRADRRPRRRPDDLAARADRRRPQLGLPLLLAPRRELRARGAASGTASSRRQARGGAGCCAPSPATRTTSRSCTARPASAG